MMMDSSFYINTDFSKIIKLYNFDALMFSIVNEVIGHSARWKF
jgi:hypothetical protein